MQVSHETHGHSLEKLPGLENIGFTGSLDDLHGFLRCEALAFSCAEKIAAIIEPGWSEAYTASLMEQFLRDSGVKSFFHKPFVWFGERTRFDGIKTYRDYQPTSRVLLEDDVFILDVAPILGGYVSDIGYTSCLTERSDLKQAKDYLAELEVKIPQWALENPTEVWSLIDQDIREHGYENIHKTYPFSVLGHRVHKVRNQGGLSLLHFGWQSYWSLLSRGLFGQLLNQDYSGNLQGLWAIEPHIGTASFGAKFEKILVVTDQTAQFLSLI